MRTHAPGGLPLPDPRDLFRCPGWLIGGLAVAGARLAQETAAIFAAIHALPRLVTALERLGPAADALATLAETTATLEELARNAKQVPPALGQLQALHEQMVAVACDLRALEPEIEGLAASAASLDRSIQVFARAFGPLRDGTGQAPARRSEHQ
jgi:ABC-type transporter Mla subunit MlaD